MRYILLLLLVVASQELIAKPRLVLVTIDGLRWQEVFRGADDQLIGHKDYVSQPQLLKQKFWRDTQQQRRQQLMPFFWNTMAKHGVVLGNRDIGSNMSIANPWHFSYPGYSEIFTGVVDESIDSNGKINNAQVSFLEWLNNKNEYGKTLAAFGSWDVFPYILNTQRSQLHVNAGFDSAGGYAISDEVKLLNQLQQEIPSPWHSVRLDAFTHRFAKDYLLQVQPEVMIIAYGETDDFAHDGEYDQYLNAIKRTDSFIADLWQTLQSIPGYKDNSILLLTTDHGRGSNPEDWQHHASQRALAGYMKKLSHFKQGILGSEHTWFAAMGPGIQAKGQVTTHTEVKQQQIAATAIELLGYSREAFNPKAATAIQEVLSHD